MSPVMGLWFTFILILLLLSLCLPGAFIGAILVFYVPIIVGLIYLIWELVGPIWFTIVLICLGLCIV